MVILHHGMVKSSWCKYADSAINNILGMLLCAFTDKVYLRLIPAKVEVNLG